MTITITNSGFKGQRFVSVPAGSRLPDMLIDGSVIAAEDVAFEERDPHQSDPPAAGHDSKIYRFPPARR